MIGSKRRAAKPAHTELRAAAALEAIPERGLKIGEAARLIGVEAYVLRFWETQFGCLRPRHARSKHRFYQSHDIETLRLIKRLLHDEGFTIAGANKYIRENGVDGSKIARPNDQPQKRAVMLDGAIRETLAELRRDLESIHKMLQH